MAKRFSPEFKQQAIDYALFSRQFLIRDSVYLILFNIHQ